MRELFPLFQTAPQSAAAALPLLRDVAMDYEKGAPLFAGGNPVVVSGLEAVKSWAWRAIQTARYRYSSFSWDYGCELENLVGQPYGQDTRRSEAVRYVQECLLINPYITDVRQIDVTFHDATLSIHCAVDTLYGEVQIDAPGL